MPHPTTHSNAPKYVSKRCVADRYDKNERTITRWVEDPKLDFPQPVKINGRWYFETTKLDEFDRRLAVARLLDIARRHQAEAARQLTQAVGGVA